MKMDILAKILWVIAIVIIVFALLWFLLGETAFFQRSLEFRARMMLIFCIPALIFAIVLIVLLIRGWKPESISTQRIFALGMMSISIIFALWLIPGVKTEGWLTEKVEGDFVQITSDGKYEYQLQLINLYQNNSYARLYVKEISTDSEAIIRLDIQTKEITGLVHPSKPSSAWAIMDPTDTENIYILTTTNKIWMPITIFEIDMITKTSQLVS